MSDAKNLLLSQYEIEEIRSEYGHLSKPVVAAFDLDNTLHDIIELYEEVTNLTRENFGLPRWEREDFHEIHKDGFVDNKTLFKKIFASKYKKAIDFFYDCFHKSSFSKDWIIPGATYMLYRLKNVYNLKIIGVTNSEQHIAKRALRELGMSEFFDSVTGPKGNRKVKPDTELLVIGLGKIGEYVSRNVWFTGDAATDTLCARNAGCVAIRFYNGEEIPEDSNADAFCNSHYKLEKIYGVLLEYYCKS